MNSTGPGNMAIDAEGNIWATQNYTYAKPSHGAASAPGRILTKLLPNGQDAPNAPFKGGGLKGAGLGSRSRPMGTSS